MKRRRKQSENHRPIAAMLIALVVLGTSCIGDDLARLTDDIVHTIGADRPEAERIAQSLITRYGSEADEVFAAGGRSVALDIDTSLAGALARVEQRSKQTQTIASVACDIVTDIVATGDFPDEDTIAETIRDQVVEQFAGEAAATAGDIFETAQAVQDGDVEQTQLGFTQLLYCDILS